jgi:hypothetical protein
VRDNPAAHQPDYDPSARRQKAARNCWEVKGCGREPGGHRVEECGVCPAATARAYNGNNRGINGGRYCWRVAGTLCHLAKEAGETEEGKRKKCGTCAFHLQVLEEEGSSFMF